MTCSKLYALLKEEIEKGKGEYNIRIQCIDYDDYDYNGGGGNVAETCHNFDVYDFEKTITLSN